MTVGELGRRMSALELAEWRAEYRLRMDEDQRANLKNKSLSGLQNRPKRRR